ncbi:MAG: hypothetical protein ABJA71_04530 [Ginsengibacter sp.]
MKKYIVTSLLSLVYFVAYCTISFAQIFDSAKVYDSENEYSDSAHLFVLQGDTVLEKFTFDPSFDSVRAYKSRQDFKYMRYLDSLLRKTKGLTIDTISLSSVKAIKGKRHLLKRSYDDNGNDVFNTSFVRTLFWVLAIFFIVFILYRLFLTESIFKKTPRRLNVPAQPDEAVITPFAYERMINDAVINKDFRLAIRYLYLQTLQMLSLAGLIQFSPDKTNYEYVNELSGKIHQNEFASLTLNYEYVWYGNFNIDQGIFKRLQKDFKQYHQKL